MAIIHIVLLSGGSGTRLWPLSNSIRSKQFLKVLRDETGLPQSMTQRVFSQITHVRSQVDVTIATGALQEELIRRQLDGPFELIIEPERRDTAAAIMLACAHLEYMQAAELADTVVVMPIDTFADQAYFDHIVDLDRAVQSDAADLVLLGVQPLYPSEKYGYIVPSAENQNDNMCAFPVLGFHEKPEKKKAIDLIGRGALWNCGVFAFKLGWLRNLTSLYIKHNNYSILHNKYRELPNRSFDYEVVEKADSVAVVPYGGEWKDLGTWSTLTEEMPEASCGYAVLAECENVHVINETGLPMVVSGLSDSVVVATADGILACSKDASARIKEHVSLVSESRPMCERRRWGEYRVIDGGIRRGGGAVLTKKLSVDPGAQISYQRHTYRDEVWTIVEGHGEIVLDGEVQMVHPGCVVSISAGRMHAVRAGGEGLQIIEVQLGCPLVEEDIERFGNWWNELDVYK